MRHKDHLIWIDLEMTGLNPEQDTILEIATIITDSELHIVAEGPVIAIHQPENLLAGMDEWNTNQHSHSGLIDRVRESNCTMMAAEQRTLAFLEQHAAAGQSPMCGNSICQDRRFMARWMPNLERFFHYRNLDVSSVKELARRWRPDLLAGVKKKSAHLALDDIKDSIAELKHYQEHFFRIRSS